MFAAILLPAVWIGTWAAAPSGTEAALSFSGRTLREAVHLSIGGTAVRVRLTNRFGDAPLEIGAVSIAASQHDAAAAVPGSVRTLTFAGSPSVTIPPHADVFSDALPLRLAAQSDVLVSTYVSSAAGPPTCHHLAFTSNYAGPGNLTDRETSAGFTIAYSSWCYLSELDVSGSAARGAVVAFGDSITDGAGSTFGANERWPDLLARRTPWYGMLNEGISGNRLLLSSPAFGIDALARFDSDVLSQSDAVTVVVLLGINDIQQSPHQYDPARVEFGLEQIALRAHVHGLRVVGCTLTPYEGWHTYDARGEATRLAVNEFVRTSRTFDAIADFDAAVRDPNDPHRLLPAFDSGDHLHPNSSGYGVMAASFDLSTL